MDKYILRFIHLEMYNFTEPFQEKKKKENLKQVKYRK